MLRLVHGEAADPSLHAGFTEFLRALAHLDEEAADAAECLAALRLLRTLGLDAGDLPAALEGYEPQALAFVQGMRSDLISRVNRGLSASGL